MSPKTPLPWKELPCSFDNQCVGFDPRDADYMLYAANSIADKDAEIERLKDELRKAAE